MIQNLYTIYDKKASYYSKPFIAQNDEVAQRMIKNTFTDQNAQQSEYVKNSEDFVLVGLGTFDDSTGKIESTIKPVLDLHTLKYGDEDEK